MNESSGCAPRCAWPTLLLAFVLIGLVSGPVQSWPTFEPLLGARGVLGSTRNSTSVALDQVYSIGSSIGIGLSIPCGIAYDSFGGRFAFGVGAVSAAVGLAGTALAIMSPALNWMLFWSYPTAVAGGYFTAYALMDWIWLLPRHRMLVGGLIGASVAASDSLSLVGIALNECCGVSLPQFFLGLSALALACGFLGVLTTPSKATTDRAAAQGEAAAASAAAAVVAPPASDAEAPLLGVNGSGSGDRDASRATGALAPATMGAVTDDASAVRKSDDVGSTTASSGTALRRCCDGLNATGHLLRKCAGVVRLFPLEVLALTICVQLVWFSFIYSSRTMLDNFTDLFGRDSAGDLLDLFALVTGIEGVIVSIAAGWVMDRIGMRLYTYVLLVIQVASMVLQVIPLYNVQIAWLVVWLLNMSTLSVWYLQFALHYAPPSVFATLQGTIAALMVIPQLVLGSPLDDAARALFPAPHSRQRFVVPYLVLNGATVLSTVFLALLWCVRPPPSVGRVAIDPLSGKVVLQTVQAPATEEGKAPPNLADVRPTCSS